MANHKVTPADMVSVQSNSISYLYFVNQKGFVSSLRSNSSNGVEAESAGFYKKESVNVTKKDADDNEVTVPVKTHTDLKQIAAVAYKDNQERYQVRLYYAEEGTLRIRELCRTDGGKWYEGALGRTTSYKLPAGSSISASVQGGQLKVFACSDDDINEEGNQELSCFYAQLGSLDWARRRITNDIKY